MKTYISFFFMMSFVLTMLITSSCKKTDWYPAIGPPLNAYVKYIDAIPQSDLDFYAYYAKQTSGVKYGVDQPYTNSPFGNITLYATNTNQTSNRITVSTSASTPEMNGQGLWADKYQTLIACKATDSTSADDAILLRDDLDDAPGDGFANVRFVNLAQRGSSSYKTVNFNILNGPGGAKTLFDSLMYRVPSKAVLIDPSKGLNTPGLGVYTSGPFTTIPAGTYDFEVKSTDGTVTIATMTGVIVGPGRTYTFYSSGKVGDAVATPMINMLLHSPNAAN